jgi:3-phosphoshikimate 1-carboxyvinyltransferase
MASAQVKSALLLAGLASKGVVRVTEPVATRNHTELMLADLGVDIKVAGNEITIGAGVQAFNSFDLDIPGDPSSAAFPAALATLVPKKDVTFPGLLLNPTRLGFFRALKRMGAQVEWTVEKRVLGEEVGHLRVRSSTLNGIKIRGDEIPTLIDEIPILAILACNARGETVVRDADELRLKECDRIKAIVENLRRMGARIQELSDGFRILGSSRLRGATISTHSDHRIAMAFAVAGKITREKTTIDDPDCVEISFPGYHKLISRLKA